MIFFRAKTTMCAFHLTALHIATSVYNNIIEYYLSENIQLVLVFVITHEPSVS